MQNFKQYKEFMKFSFDDKLDISNILTSYKRFRKFETNDYSEEVIKFSKQIIEQDLDTVENTLNKVNRIIVEENKRIHCKN